MKRENHCNKVVVESAAPLSLLGNLALHLHNAPQFPMQERTPLVGGVQHKRIISVPNGPGNITST